MKYLITGGAGFVGSNLSRNLIERGSDEVHVFDNLSRKGSSDNLRWLESSGKFTYHPGDIRVQNDIERVIQSIRPDVIYHVCGQVAMTTSIANPMMDFQINAMGSFHVLESARRWAPDATIVYSSTNKVYGDLGLLAVEETPTRYVLPARPRGVDESYPLSFESPYGCSKGAADQYMLDYHRIFGLRTVVFRHSSMYGGRQYPTFDQGWISWFALKALEIKRGQLGSFTIAGDGKQVRDLLFSEDLVRCYHMAAEAIEKTKGQVYNIGGGAENSLSLLELFALLEDALGIKMKFEVTPWRAREQKVFIADTAKAERDFGWTPQVSSREGLTRLLKWIETLTASA